MLFIPRTKLNGFLVLMDRISVLHMHMACVYHRLQYTPYHVSLWQVVISSLGSKTLHHLRHCLLPSCRIIHRKPFLKQQRRLLTSRRKNRSCQSTCTLAQPYIPWRRTRCGSIPCKIPRLVWVASFWLHCWWRLLGGRRRLGLGSWEGFSRTACYDGFHLDKNVSLYSLSLLPCGHAER